jgi:hypothetical protein
MNKEELSLKQIVENLQKKETIDDKILFLCGVFRHLKTLKLKNFYLYSVKKSFEFQGGYLFLLGAAIIFLLFRQPLSSLICFVPSVFLYFSPLLAKKLLDKTKEKSLANSRLLPHLIKKYHSDYKTLRVVKTIINPFHFKRLS